MQICWFQADLLSHTHATTYVSQLFTLDLENTHGMVFFFSLSFLWISDELNSLITVC